MVVPSTATLGPSEKKTFSAQGAETWELNPPGVGTLTDREYTAPSQIPEKKQISIVAKDNAGAEIGRATVTLRPPLTVVPCSVDLTSGQQQQFNVEGAEPRTVTWELNPPGIGTLQDGTYTAPSEIPANQQVNIIAKDTASAWTGSATVTLVLPLRVAPGTADLGPGQQQQFNVEPAEPVTWSLQQPKVGDVNESGVYTAPKRIFDQRSVVLTAKSNRQPPRFASATINLQNAASLRWILALYWIVVGVVLSSLAILMWGKVSTPSNLPDVVVSPWIVTLPPGGTQVFTANTPGSPGEANISYTWSGPNGVTLTNGEYTAPDTTLSPTPIIITARRNDDATKFGAATVLLSGSKDHALQIVPGAAVLRLGQLFPFAASGAGGSHADVEWKVPSNVGHVLPDGLYRAPNSVEDSQIIAILAKSKDGSQAAANITLLPSVDNSGRTTYLLFFVLVIGALGSCLHGLSSFVTFVGNRQFVSSWFWWYLFQPLMGGILALLVFFVIGGGFLAGQSTSNTLQVAAIAGLVGLFSAQATLKLKDLVETIFTTRSDARSGKLTESLKPSIMSVNPPTFDHASPPPELEINGTNFVSGCKVNINGSPKPVIKVSPTKLTVSLAGSVFASATTLKIVVINSSGDTSEEYPVTIT